jgi:hypothetical protein
LPDGLFSYQKSQFGHIWESLGMKNVNKFYDHLQYSNVIWYVLWRFGIVCGHLVHFPPFGMLEARKIWQPCI